MRAKRVLSGHCPCTCATAAARNPLARSFSQRQPCQRGMRIAARNARCVAAAASHPLRRPRSPWRTRARKRPGGARRRRAALLTGERARATTTQGPKTAHRSKLHGAMLPPNRGRLEAASKSSLPVGRPRRTRSCARRPRCPSRRSWRTGTPPSSRAPCSPCSSRRKCRSRCGTTTAQRLDRSHRQNAQN